MYYTEVYFSPQYEFSVSPDSSTKYVGDQGKAAPNPIVIKAIKNQKSPLKSENSC